MIFKNIKQMLLSFIIYIICMMIVPFVFILQPLFILCELIMPDKKYIIKRFSYSYIDEFGNEVLCEGHKRCLRKPWEKKELDITLADRNHPERRIKKINEKRRLYEIYHSNT